MRKRKLSLKKIMLVSAITISALQITGCSDNNKNNSYEDYEDNIVEPEELEEASIIEKVKVLSFIKKNF